jgi:hypothetical protein
MTPRLFSGTLGIDRLKLVKKDSTMQKRRGGYVRKRDASQQKRTSQSRRKRDQEAVDMFHSVAAFEYSKIRQEELIRQAEECRLVSQARKARRANRRSVMDRVAQVVGTWLVKADKRFKTRQMSSGGEAI